MKELLDKAAAIAELLKARRQTVAIAESSSGGLISAALLAIPGASNYYLGGGVVYTARARVLLMDISKEEVVGMRSSSEPYAELLATTARRRFRADWGLSETGAAGPGGNSYGDASGHTCIAVAGAAPKVVTIETGSDDRYANMLSFAGAALDLLHQQLLLADPQ